jgi:hypothetical protein
MSAQRSGDPQLRLDRAQGIAAVLGLLLPHGSGVEQQAIVAAEVLDHLGGAMQDPHLLAAPLRRGQLP